MDVGRTQPDGLVTKLVNSIRCRSGPCGRCCDFLLDDRSSLQKTDARHVINFQPLSSARPPADPGAAPDVADHRSRSSGLAPAIDMRPIEFWTANRGELVQPRAARRRLPSESEISIYDIQPDLYGRGDAAAAGAAGDATDADECLTDEQKLVRFQLGQVHFSMQYELATNSLMVRVIAASDLPPPFAHDAARRDLAHSNPYAKVCLLPDQKDSRQTSVRRKTQSPEWGELFAFELPFKEVKRRTLEITVKDFDKYSHHCVTGRLQLPLENANLVKGGHMWKPLLPCTKENCDLGDVLLSLNYLPTAGRLNVDIIKARQLLQTDLDIGSDPFVKVTLCHHERTVKSKKTSVKRNTIDPVFNESVSFNVTLNHLGDCTLVVSAWHHKAKSRDDFIGRFLLGQQATGAQEAAHWARMLRCQRSPVAQWHTLLTRRECDETCPLSAAVS